MSDNPITKQELIDASKDAKTIEQCVNGDETTDVTTRLGRTFPSFAKAIKIMTDAYAALLLWISTFETAANIWYAAFQSAANSWYATQQGNVNAWITSFYSDMSARYLAYRVRGAWATSTSYAVQDLVAQSGVEYICLAAHTSATFTTDLTAGKWAIYQGITTSSLFTNIWANPLKYGAAGNGTTDDTAAIISMFTTEIAAGRKLFDFLDRDYLINLTEGSTLFSFINKRGIRIRGSGRILDNRTYTNPSLTIMFSFTTCTDCRVDFNYQGTPISSKSDPTYGVGYMGLTWVNCDTNCYDIEVRGNVNYLRYGVRTGDYSTPSKGYNTKINTYLTTIECGYPIAHYLANDIHAIINCQGSHRGAYLAGVNGGRVDIYCKNNYISPTLGCLISDATTNGTTGSGGTSRGSSNLIVNVTDMGSTIFVSTSWLVTLSPSRVDPNTIYENITINAKLIGTDTICSSVGLFALYSAVNGTIPGFYPFNWESTITIRNIKVSGMLNRSSQTVANGNSSGELYIYTTDSGAHSATVDGITFEDLTILNGSGTFPRSLYFVNPIMVSPINFNRVNFSNYPLVIQNSSNVATNITNSIIGGVSNNLNLSDTTLLNFINTKTFIGQPLTNTNFSNSPMSGAGIQHKILLVDVNLSGPSVTVPTTSQIPSGAIVLGVSATIETAITGSSGFKLGTAANPTLFALSASTAVGTKVTPANAASPFTGPLLFTAFTQLVVTSVTSNFTGGTLRIAVAYYTMSAPT